MLRSFGQAMTRSLKIGCASYFTAKYLVNVTICKGGSMEPTIQSDNVFVTDQLSPRLGWIEIGDVVIAKDQVQDHGYICKRVAAKEGEIVLYENQLLQIPEGHVWLLGDNKSNSKDSRRYGPVPVEDIRSRCWFRIWPDFNKDVLAAPPTPPKFSRTLPSSADEQENTFQDFKF